MNKRLASKSMWRPIAAAAIAVLAATAVAIAAVPLTACLVSSTGDIVPTVYPMLSGR